MIGCNDLIFKGYSCLYREHSDIPFFPGYVHTDTVNGCEDVGPDHRRKVDKYEPKRVAADGHVPTTEKAHVLIVGNL